MSEFIKLQLRKDAEDRAREHGFEPGQLQWKWRMNPPPYTADGKWHRECVSAILDALNREGIPAWDGDAVSCVAQIVEAYAKLVEKKEP